MKKNTPLMDVVEFIRKVKEENSTNLQALLALDRVILFVHDQKPAERQAIEEALSEGVGIAIGNYEKAHGFDDKSIEFEKSHYFTQTYKN